MPLPYELYLALRYLRFHRGRTFLSVITTISIAGVTVGVAALVIALSLNAGFIEDVRARIYSGSAHLTLLSGEADGPFPGAEALQQRLERIDGVTAAAPVMQTPALLSFEEIATHGFAELQGVDPTRHRRVLPPEDGRATLLARLDRPAGSSRAGIVLGRELARKLGALEGDQVRVLIPQITLAPWSAYPRSRVYEVVGIYSSDHFQEDLLRSYISLDEARSLLRAQGRTSWVDVRLDDVRRLVPMRERLRAELAPQWIVIDLIEQNHEIIKALNTERLVLFLAIGLIVVVASLNIVSTLILLVNDKVREIGTLTALGARPSGVASVFMLQGMVIGVIGTVLGIAIGWSTCWVLDTYRLFPLDPEVYYLDHLPFRTGASEVLWVAVVSLLISFLATIHPARRAAALDPVEAIRHE